MEVASFASRCDTQNTQKAVMGLTSLLSLQARRSNRQEGFPCCFSEPERGGNKKKRMNGPALGRLSENTLRRSHN